jgi:hypothetical protein
MERIPDDTVIDDALIARLRAARDRTTDPAERAKADHGLAFLATCRGMTFAQAQAKGDTKLRDAEAKLSRAQKGVDKADAAYATALNGYIQTGSPVPGSYSLYRITAAPAPPAATIPASQVLDRHAQLHDALARPGRLLTGLIAWYGEWADLGREPGTAPEAGKEYPGGWLTRYMLYPYKVGGQRPRAGWEAKFLAWLARGLFTAATYQVTTAMCEIAEAMYEQTAAVSG